MDKVTIDLDRETCCAPGTGFQVSIGKVDEAGYGHGHRIFGPKFCAVGGNVHIQTHELSERDARAIFGYIRPLLGDEWLADQLAKPSSAGVASFPTAPADGPAGIDPLPASTADDTGSGR